jgi:hypothetical protein
MRLVIRRTQADMKGVFGGNKGVQFNLYYKLSLSPDEAALVERYKLGFHVLSTAGSGATETVNDVLRGVNQAVQSVPVLLRNEAVIKRACNSFYELIAVAKSFGGEEVIDFPISGLSDE